MKKLIPVALIAALASVQLVSVAQTAHVHDHQATPEAGAADMKAMREEMQKKMAAAKTDAERQQLMAEQRTKMQGTPGRHGQMHAQNHAQMHAQGGTHEHGSMKGMPGAEMHKRMHEQTAQ